MWFAWELGSPSQVGLRARAPTVAKLESAQEIPLASMHNKPGEDDGRAVPAGVPEDVEEAVLRPPEEDVVGPGEGPKISRKTQTMSAS